MFLIKASSKAAFLVSCKQITSLELSTTLSLIALIPLFVRVHSSDIPTQCSIFL